MPKKRGRGRGQKTISSFFQERNHETPAPAADLTCAQETPAPAANPTHAQETPAPAANPTHAQETPAPATNPTHAQETPAANPTHAQETPAANLMMTSDHDEETPSGAADITMTPEQETPSDAAVLTPGQETSAADPTAIPANSVSAEEQAPPQKRRKKKKKKEEKEEEKQEPKKQQPVKKFSKGWLDRFKWLAYDGTLMYCKWCREQRRDSNLATGTDNFRLSSLERHLPTDAHTASMAVRAKGQGKIVRGMQSAALKRAKAVEAALRTVYWTVTEEVANRKYESLLQLQRLQGVQAVKDLNAGRNATHTSPTAFNDFLRCLNNVLERKVTREVRTSPFVAVGIDESTDRSSEKHMVVVIRYVRVPTAELVTTFLKCAKVEDGKAATIYQKTLDILQEYNIPLRKVLGLGMDGAAVMSSDLNGVTGLLHRDNPFTVAVHCVCHRLHLAAAQGTNGIPQMKSASLLVDSIYNYIMRSPNRLAEFKTLADVLGEDYIKLKHVFEIRWLSMGEAIDGVLRNHRALAVYTEEKAADGDPTAIGLHQQLTSYLPMALLHLLGDVLDVTNHLSRLFQYRDITFSSLSKELTECFNSLEAMRQVDGPKLERFRVGVEQSGNFRDTPIEMRVGRGGRQPLEALQDIRAAFLERLLENLHARFPQVELLEAMKIFDPASYPAAGDNLALVYWGRDEFNTLMDHYAQRKVTRDGNVCEKYIDQYACEGQFGAFKQAVAARFKGEERVDENGVAQFHYYRPNELFKKMFGGANADYQQIFSEVFKLMCCCLVVMVSNAEAERVFSCQNRIKTKTRTLLSIDQLDRLIRLSYARIPMADFDFAAAREDYLLAPRRL
ncbi:ZNF862 [Branchiostoma lanceolatum]|uniref:ZNF862 protein n=1 Tax=Branchiostoma lanceolatum TaxID=7740 RepID=A0A8J9Z1P9_BRALA|nr:ZNF862 [Branchiostoma lanceolatum]